MKDWFSKVLDWPHQARVARFSSKTLAFNLGVSQRQLQRMFHDAFGLKVHTWLNEVRLRDAVHLLTPQRSIKETAFLLGFRDASHFSHRFKEKFGMAPETFLQNAGVSFRSDYELEYIEIEKSSNRLAK